MRPFKTSSPVVALDVAILVPDAVAGPAREINRALAAGEPDALRLDDSHLPHITLAQQFVEGARLGDLSAALDRILRHERALPLRVTGTTADRGTVQFAVDSVPDLQRVHELVMDVLEPFESPEGGPAAFERGGERIRSRDVTWVRDYREQAAYARYSPHVTLGHGSDCPAVAPVAFTATRLAVCHLGRFCTCQTILHEWTLARRRA
jgi:2'-5' RNA ligase